MAGEAGGSWALEPREGSVPVHVGADGGGVDTEVDVRRLIVAVEPYAPPCRTDRTPLPSEVFIRMTELVLKPCLCGHFGSIRVVMEQSLRLTESIRSEWRAESSNLVVDENDVTMDRRDLPLFSSFDSGVGKASVSGCDGARVYVFSGVGEGGGRGGRVWLDMLCRWRCVVC